MWRIPVSPPIPVYTSEYKGEVRGKRKTRLQVWNAIAAPITFSFAPPMGYRWIIQEVVILNTGALNYIFTWFDPDQYAYCYWEESTAAGACIIYNPYLDAATIAGGMPLITRPLGIDRIEEREQLDIFISPGPLDAGNLYVVYDEVKIDD